MTTDRELDLIMDIKGGELDSIRAQMEEYMEEMEKVVGVTICPLCEKSTDELYADTELACSVCTLDGLVDDFLEEMNG